MNLEKNGKLKNFFYFRYTIPEIHLKVGVWRNNTSHDDLVELFRKFTVTTVPRKDTEFIPVYKTDIINGIPDFLMSSTGRKLSEILKRELGQNLNHFQVFFILHYFFNNINFSNLDEAKVAFYHVNDFFQKLK